MNLKKNWKTTVGGILLLLDCGACAMGYINHTTAELIAGGLVSYGFIAAADADKVPPGK